MIDRIFTKSLLKKIDAFPVVALLGPRQCGKTTMIKAILRDWKYIDLEKPSDFIPFEEDPEQRLYQLKGKTILDEAQQLPQLFPILRGYVDENRDKNGLFVLLGSASPRLITQISETLAGRVSFLELTPFLYKEIYDYNTQDALIRLWYHGGFPDAFLQEERSNLLDWFDGYTRTFIERDLVNLGINISGLQMRKLWTMIAHFNGNVWNASQLASSLGVNYQTVNKYTDILEQTFFIRKLPPYFVNIGKRIVKSPKIYFRDTGLLHYFTGIHSIEQLNTHPARGASWEGFLIEQIIALYQLYVPGSRFYYWRTAGGSEVDLLVESTGRIIPFEIKLHSAPTNKMVQGLNACMQDLGINKGYVVYPGDELYHLSETVTVIPAKKLLLDTNFLQTL
jgi:predicted AAA+ superfamily ATPase